MDPSESLREYVLHRMEQQALKFVKEPVVAHVVFSSVAEKQIAECNFSSGEGYHLHAKAESSDLYSSAYQMVDKIVSQLRRKRKQLDHHLSKAPFRRKPEVSSIDSH